MSTSDFGWTRGQGAGASQWCDLGPPLSGHSYLQDGDRREVLSGSSARVPGLSGSLSPAAPEHKADLGVHHKPWDWTSVPPGQHTQARVALCRATGAYACVPKSVWKGSRGQTARGPLRGSGRAKDRAVRASPRVSLKPGNETRLSPADPLITGSGSHLSEYK